VLVATWRDHPADFVVRWLRDDARGTRVEIRSAAGRFIIIDEQVFQCGYPLYVVNLFPTEDVIMTDFLDEKRQEIQDRLAELRPLIDEYQRLEAAASALDGVDGDGVSAASARAAATTRRKPGRPPGSGRGPGRPPSSGRGPGRPRGSGRGPGRPPGSGRKAPDNETQESATKAPAGRRGRPKGSGSRTVQTLSLVQEHPGIGVPELADRMGIKQNYLYRVLPGLEQEGKIRKQGRGWHPIAEVKAAA